MTPNRDPHVIGNHRQGQTLALGLVIVAGLVLVIALSRWMDAMRSPVDPQAEEERLYLTGETVKRMSLGFNGLVADWYWMRSLQYVGNKILSYPGEIQLDDLGPLDMRLLYPLLDTATTLDPQFMAAYNYGAIVLPAINEEDAIKLIRKGMEKNPTQWRLYQHLGYIYWKRGDYQKASEVYGEGARVAGAPQFMQQLSARMIAQGGSRETARQMYLRLYEETDDPTVKELLARRLMQVDSFEERDEIRRTIEIFKRRIGRCPRSWKEILAELRAVRFPKGNPLRFDPTGAPLDPSDAPYVLSPDGCDVQLNHQTRVPFN